MRNTLKASMAAILLSSVALVPAATVVTFASADFAYAKSDNAGGVGNGKSGEAQEKIRGKSGTNSGSSSATNRGYSNGLGRLLNKLTGQDKRSTRSASASGKAAKGSGMHPSELGNMNGALNSNINAMLAHIRNGNTNGPVGHLAALAVAANGAQELLNQEAEFLALEGALAAAGYDSIGDYYTALGAEPGIDPIMSIEDAKEGLSVLPGNTDLQDALDLALETDGYIGDTALADYDADVAGASDADLNQAIADLGGDADAGNPITDELPLAEDIAGAQDALTDAEAGILDYWNKSDVVTGKDQVLLDALYDRFEGNEDAIADAIGEAEAGEEILEGVVECEGAEDCLDDDMAELIE